MLLVAAAAACYVGVVALRHGPPPGGDTAPLTAVTTDLSYGDLRAAASNTALPNPPGYALLASPFVFILRSQIGSPIWCIPATRPTEPRPLPAGPQVSNSPYVAVCGSPVRLPDGAIGPPMAPWYRAQGVIGLLAWLLLAAGSLALLRAASVDSLGHRAAVLAFLVVLPAASSAIVQLYHPQDIASLGLSAFSLAQAMRHRWVLSGFLFGLAILTKQFALLVMIPTVVSAPDARARLRLVVPAVAIFGAGIMPFVVAAAHATLDNLSGFGTGGALGGSTFLTIAGGQGNVASAVARDAPIVFSTVVSLLAWKRFHGSLGRPDVLTALVLVCLGSRLIFESVIFPYYLLATCVLFFVHDLIALRSPALSLAWCALATFFAALHPANQMLAASGTFAFSVVAVGAGLAEVWRGGKRGMPVLRLESKG